MGSWGGIGYLSGFCAGREFGCFDVGRLIMVFSFSMKFNVGLSTRLTAPRDAVICRRLSMSAWLMARVSRIVGKNTSTKVATPIVRVIQLAKVSHDCSRKVIVPAKADESSILPEEPQSMVRP